MTVFSHYTKLKRILDAELKGWYIRRIDEPTTATNFGNEKTYFDHYYRLYSVDRTQIKYGKFQQLDRLARALGIDPADLPVISE